MIVRLLSTLPRPRVLGAEAPIIGLTVLLWIVASSVVDGYTTDTTIGNIFGRSATDGLLVCGLTLCLLAGRIDLSIGSTLALSSVVWAIVDVHVGLWTGVVAGIAAGLGIGVINAILVVVLGIDSFVATLGTLLLAKGLAFLASGGQPITGKDIDAALWMNETLFAFISPRALIFIFGALAVHAFVTRTRYGRDIIAIGGNQAAAAASGIPCARRLGLVFCLSGALSGLAGVVLGISLLAGSPAIGDANLLTAAAAAFLAGAALTGGRGSVLGSAIAVVALSSLAAGLELSFIKSAYQTIVTGSILVLAVGAHELFRHLRRGSGVTNRWSGS